MTTHHGGVGHASENTDINFHIEDAEGAQTAQKP